MDIRKGGSKVSLALTLKRLALVAGAVGTAGALVTGASFAMFNSTSGFQENTFAAGTVTLGDASPSFICQISNMEPGDSTPYYQSQGGSGSDTQCQDTVTYTGSLPAWIGLTIENDSPNSDSGSTIALENPQDPNALQLHLADSCGNTFALPAPNGENTVTDLVNGSGCNDGNSDGSVNDGWTDTFTLDYYLPLGASNQYQGGTAEVELQVVAVQASNNELVDGVPQNGWGTDPAMAN
jgi:predicted ribosomally synthesized peptide with SipW-like signal peptide